MATSRSKSPPSKSTAKRAAKKNAAPARASEDRRSRRSADDIRPKIIRAATDEFKKYGYAGATTASIARKADVTEAQLFRYFGSKSKLYRETIFEPMDQHLQTFMNEHMGSINESAGRRKNTDLYTTELQRFIRDNSSTLVSLVMTQAYDAGAEHGLGRIDSLKSYFEHGASAMRSRLKGEPPVAPELMVRLAFVSVLGAYMLRDWIFPQELASDEALEAAINAFVQKGVSANDKAR